MNRFLCLIVACGLFLSSLNTFAQALSPAFEEATFILLDPHAGSNQKMTAIRVLMSHPYEAKSPQVQRIIAALVRQAHYDLEPVRELARTAVREMIGRREADLLIATYAPTAYIPPPGDFVVDFNLAAKGWVRADEWVDSLASNQAEVRRDGMKSLSQRAAADPKHLTSLDEPLKSRLLEHLGRFDRVEPAVRRHTLVLVEQLGPESEAGIRILQRSMADGDRNVQQFVARFYAAAENRPEHQAMVAAITRGLTDPDQDISAAAVKLMPAVPEDSMKVLIAQAVAAAAVRGDLEQIKLLKTYDVKPAVFEQATHLALKQTKGDTDRLFILKAMRRAGADSGLDDAPEFRNLIAGLLTRDLDSIGVAAAELCTTAKSRQLAVDTMVATINEGKLLSPPVVKALKPDPESFSRLLIEPLGAPRPAVRRSAARALLAAGVKGDNIREVLIPLLRDRDRDVRLSAAAILNTPQALARATLPDLLNDLRSDTLSARHLAARQIDELGIEPKEVTAALIRAVATGNFAARQGLLAALEEANFSGQNPLDLLNRVAAGENQSAGPRAYARAALREIKP